MSEYEYLYSKLTKCKKIEIEDINRDEIEDVKNIKINENLSPRERIRQYLIKAKYPYILKNDDTLVKISFKPTSADFSRCMNNIVKNSYLQN